MSRLQERNSSLFFLEAVREKFQREYRELSLILVKVEAVAQ